MVLNPDCVRDVLLTVESCSFGQHLTLNALCGQLSEYTEEEVHYTCLKLKEGGYLNMVTFSVLRMPMPGIKQINNLTCQGREFLNSIREATNWGKVKAIAKKAGTFSLQSLGMIAQEVAKAATLSALQLNP